MFIVMDVGDGDVAHDSVTDTTCSPPRERVVVTEAGRVLLPLA